jgi:hypothetical protein
MKKIISLYYRYLSLLMNIQAETSEQVYIDQNLCSVTTMKGIHIKTF